MRREHPKERAASKKRHQDLPPQHEDLLVTPGDASATTDTVTARPRQFKEKDANGVAQSRTRFICISFALSSHVV